MADNQMTMSHENDDRFRKPGVIGPLIFLIFSIIFTYGVTCVALLGIANWIMHAYSLKYFLSQGNLGIVLLALLILLCWAASVFIIAAIPYFILQKKGRPILAKKVALIILFFLFLSYTIPFILWPVIRRNSPKLNKKYRQKLKIMAKGPIMEQRLAERRARLDQKI